MRRRQTADLSFELLFYGGSAFLIFGSLFGVLSWIGESHISFPRSPGTILIVAGTILIGGLMLSRFRNRYEMQD